ncbi:MAG: hypothetical protein CMC18_02330 [Flavobacteriaceae bacterium]|nr:hypothetical protein [Flavobacteriaceae bacterium]
MLYSGILKKMSTRLNATEVNYYLELENDLIHLNQLIHKKIRLELQGYQCLNCDSDETIFAQGFCKKCFFESPKAGEWIMKPELSKAHLGEEDRDLEFEKRMQLQPHIVYLSNTGTLKVGITRKKQLPTRWIDQGAHQAMAILETPNRYLAGVAEVALKKHISDRTNWRTMLTTSENKEDLGEVFNSLQGYIPEEVKKCLISEMNNVPIDFPYATKIEKVLKSYSLKKDTNIEGVLIGIKGQYLIFKDSAVMNIRNHEGFRVGLNVKTLSI